MMIISEKEVDYHIDCKYSERILLRRQGVRRRERDREGEGHREGSLQNSPKNLDPSNMLDLYLWDSELQIRGDIENTGVILYFDPPGNSNIIFHISQLKHRL